MVSCSCVLIDQSRWAGRQAGKEDGATYRIEEWSGRQMR